PNLRKRPRTPAKGRGSVQRAIRRAFAASGTEALTSSAIYDWAHIRRRLGRRKSMPFGIYSRTLRTLRAMCDPIERVPPHGAWLGRVRDDVAELWRLCRRRLFLAKLDQVHKMMLDKDFQRVSLCKSYL